MTKKYYLKLKQGSDKYISPWKISKVIDDIAGEYYKKYLLNLIVDRIPSLKENEELIVFHDSFDMYNKYSDLKDFSFRKKEDVLDIYYLGNPIPFKPNLRIMKISLIFEMHRELFTELNSIDILMDRNKMSNYIKPNLNDKKEFDLSLLQKYLTEVLSGNKTEHIKAKNNCDKIVNKFKSRLTRFVEHTVEFDMIDGFEDENELKVYLDKSKKHNLYKNYYENFEDTFIKLGRPMVGIIDIEKGTLEILAKEFIREDLQNKNVNKIEMVSLSKNSPTAMAYIVGAIVVPWLASLVVTSLETKKVQQAKKVSDPKVPIGPVTSSSPVTPTNPELLKLEEVIKEFKELQEEIDDIDDKVVYIEDYKFKKAMYKINNKITSNTAKTLQKNDFLNENIELGIIDSPKEDEKEEIKE